MAIVDIMPSTEDDAHYIAKRVRKPDAQEVWASHMTTPLETMLRGLKNSDIALTGLVNGEPVCMWGVVTESMVGRVGIPWMVGSNALDRYAVTFLLRCREPLMEMMQNYGMLVNYVDQRNVRTIKWLKYMGFEVDNEPVPYGVFNRPFLRFVMRG